MLIGIMKVFCSRVFHDFTGSCIRCHVPYTFKTKAKDTPRSTHWLRSLHRQETHSLRTAGDIRHVIWNFLPVIAGNSWGEAAKSSSVNHTKHVTSPHTSVPVLFPKNVSPTGRDKYQIQSAITHTSLNKRHFDLAVTSHYCRLTIGLLLRV